MKPFFPSRILKCDLINFAVFGVWRKPPSLSRKRAQYAAYFCQMVCWHCVHVPPGVAYLKSLRMQDGIHTCPCEHSVPIFKRSLKNIVELASVTFLISETLLPGNKKDKCWLVNVSMNWHLLKPKSSTSTYKCIQIPWSTPLFTDPSPVQCLDLDSSPDSSSLSVVVL